MVAKQDYVYEKVFNRESNGPLMGYFIIIRGPLGIGKSTIAKALAKILKAKYISFDRVLEENGLDREDNNFIPEDFIKANEIILPKVKKCLKKGKIVIFDGNFYFKEQIDHLKKSLPYKSYIFDLKATIEKCIERNNKRERVYNEIDVREVYELVSKFDCGIKINTNKKTKEEVVEEILSYLKDKSNSMSKTNIQYKIRKTPPITIAIIIHGEPPKILETVNSIENQTYDKRNVNIMCLDDGTSPKAKKIIGSKNIKVYDLPKNCNISFAKNFALRNSKDELIFFLDDHIILDKNSISESINILKKYPDIAGVCGRYRSATFSDYNLLRDIKRESIYKKNDFERFITLENFTTFSTGIAVVKKTIFLDYDFPENIFPNDFGGEDVPTLIKALNEGKRFVYSPKISGTHEHNLTFKDFIKKMGIEIRGRFSLLYWASNNPKFRIPYLHGFLNFPYFITISLILALFLLIFSPYFILLPTPFLFYEIILSLKCLSASNQIPVKHRIKASIFVLSSDLLSLICGIQYLISPYKRPYKKLGYRKFLIINKIFLRWELEKYNLLKQ